MANSVFQKIYLKPETTFGDATGNMSSGIRLWPAEKVDLSSLDQMMSAADQVVGDETDLGPKAQKTIRSMEFSTTHIISGANRTAGAIVADDTSTFLSVAAGYRETPVATKDDCSTGCTTTSIVVTGSTTYTAGQLIAINGEVRKVATWTVGTKTLTVTLPFSAAPASGDDVLPVESWTLAGVKNSAGIGIEMPQLTTMDVLAKGVINKKFGVNVATTEPVTVSADWAAQDWTVGSGVITNAPTNEMETNPVYPDSAKGGIAFIDDDSALWNECVRSVEFTNAYEESFIECIKAVNGRGGHVMTPTDDRMCTMKVSAYMQSDTYGDIDLMSEVETEVALQIGGTDQNIVGIYFEKAYLKEYTKPSDQDRKYYADFVFIGTNARFFRA